MIWNISRQDGKDRPPVVILSSDRLFLRPPQPGDQAAWLAVRGRNREFLKPYEPSWPGDCLSAGFFRRRLARQAQDWRTDRAYSFLIFKKPDMVLIGGVNINNVSRGASQYATLGYWLDESAQGQGHMAEALRLVIDYGFETLKLHRFNAGCLSGNERSAKLLLGLGFEEEGFAKNYVQIDGRWQDHRLFGLPIERWQVSAAGSRST